MRDLWLSTLRTRGLRPVPLVVGLGLFAFSILLALGDQRIGSLPVTACLFALLVSNGLVGEDVRDGTVQLVLARPVTRTQYLAARLLGALTLTVLFVAALLATAWAAVRPPAETLLAVGVAGLAAAVWTVALIFFFSTFLPGRADALAALMLFIFAFMLRTARHHVESELGGRAIDALWDNVVCIPVVLGGLFTPAAVTDLLIWASNVLATILAAVLLFNRRQFGYAD
jgi:hypothetical protein